MKFRWTIKELDENSDARILRGLVAERMGGLNMYAPLHRRLTQIYDKLERAIQRERTRKPRTRKRKQTESTPRKPRQIITTLGD